MEVMKALEAANDAPLLRMEWIMRFLAEQVPHATIGSTGKRLTEQADFVKWLNDLAKAAEDIPSEGKRKRA